MLDVRYDVLHEDVMHILSSCYCAILVSLGDISPNFILEAISYGTPVILTRENGIAQRLGNAVMFVDPLDVDAIADAIVQMANDVIYAAYEGRVRELSFEHSYTDIAKEFITLAQVL